MKKIAALILMCFLLGSACRPAACADTGAKTSADVLRWRDIVQISGAYNCILGLRSDGRVLRAGSSEDYLSFDPHLDRVDAWRGIKKLFNCGGIIVGLKADGTVVSTSDADLSSWRNIVKVVGVKRAWLAGLKSDGTVVVTRKGELADLGWEGRSWLDTSAWQGIVDIVPEDGWTAINGLAGIRADGTVLSQYSCGMEYPESWTDIISLCSVLDGVVGIRRDGTLALPPYDLFEDFNVTAPPEKWSNLSALYSGHQDDLFALTRDGRVCAATYDDGFRLADAVSSWRNVETLYPMYARVIGIKNDGTVLYEGNPRVCYTNAMSSWRGIREMAFYREDEQIYAVGLKTDGTLYVAQIGYS